MSLHYRKIHQIVDENGIVHLENKEPNQDISVEFAAFMSALVDRKELRPQPVVVPPVALKISSNAAKTPKLKLTVAGVREGLILCKSIREIAISFNVAVSTIYNFLLNHKTSVTKLKAEIAASSSQFLVGTIKPTKEA